MHSPLTMVILLSTIDLATRLELQAAYVHGESTLTSKFVLTLLLVSRDTIVWYIYPPPLLTGTNEPI